MWVIEVLQLRHIAWFTDNVFHSWVKSCDCDISQDIVESVTALYECFVRLIAFLEMNKMFDSGIS